MIITHETITVNQDTGEVVYGKVDCPHCQAAWQHWGQPVGHRVEFTADTCPKCKGTGKRGNGNCRHCSDTHHRYKKSWVAGMVKVIDQAHAVDAGPCDTCDATGKVTTNRHNYMPPEVTQAILATMPVTIFLRVQTIGEQLFGTDPLLWQVEGITSLGGITDYGRRWNELQAARTNGTLNAFEAALIADIRANVNTRQILTLVTEDDHLIAHLGVYLGSNGYSVYGFSADQWEKVNTND